MTFFVQTNLCKCYQPLSTVDVQGCFQSTLSLAQKSQDAAQEGKVDNNEKGCFSKQRMYVYIGIMLQIHRREKPDWLFHFMLNTTLNFFAESPWTLQTMKQILLLIVSLYSLQWGGSDRIIS